MSGQIAKLVVELVFPVTYLISHLADHNISLYFIYTDLHLFHITPELATYTMSDLGYFSSISNPSLHH